MLGKIQFIIFLLTLVIPFGGILAYFFSEKELTNKENRSKTEFPSGEFSISAFPGEKLDSFISDHFWFRMKLIELNNTLNARVWRTVSHPDVIWGKSGWLFYSAQNAFDTFTGKEYLTDEQIKQFCDWLVHLESESRRLGKKFCFVLVPNKMTIYPEYLPTDKYKLKANKTEVNTVMEELRALLKEETLVDLRKVFQEEKSESEIFYYRKDTHWSGAGTVLAYRTILEQIGLEKSLAREQFLPTRVLYSGDLSRLLGLFSEEEEGVLYKIPENFLESNHKKKQNLVIYGDSFLDNLNPYLKLHFNIEQSVHVDTLVKSGNLKNLIYSEETDILIIQIVERKLINFIKSLKGS